MKPEVLWYSLKTYVFWSFEFSSDTDSNFSEEVGGVDNELELGFPRGYACKLDGEADSDS